MALKRRKNQNTPIQADRNYIELRAKALLKNTTVIKKLAPNQKIIAMVKADAYGHGTQWVCRTLKKTPNVGFGVATLEEALDVRLSIGPTRSKSIYLFSGSSPWSDRIGHFCRKHGIIPSLNSIEDWRTFVKGKWPNRIPFMLKFNSGMNRMGIPLNAIDGIFKTIRKMPSRKDFSVYTHLAVAEKPLSPLSQKQKKRIKLLHDNIKNFNESIPFHYANSSAIWNSDFWQLDEWSDWVRPGLSLYGVPPWEDAPASGLKPVMTVRARVLSTDIVQPGEKIGYGGTFTVKKKNFRTITVGMGYGDGLDRHLSNKGFGWHNARKVPILGIISMDLCTLAGAPRSKAGQWVEFIGENINIWKTAKLAETIPYTLLTSISPRVMRRYV